MAVRRVVVTIDRIRLHGVAAQDAPALVAALRAELERALTDRAGDAGEWTPAALAVLRPPPVRGSGEPRQTGRALGQVLARGLTP